MSATEISIRDRINAVQLAARDLPQVELPTANFLLNGMYVRQCCIPKGTLFVGRIHKKPHFFIIAKGSAQVTQEDGSIRLFKEGMVLMSDAGVKRCGITIEDTVFITVHRTALTDLKEIEDELTEFDPMTRYGVGNELLIDPKELK
jgi:hypothetical protein